MLCLYVNKYYSLANRKRIEALGCIGWFFYFIYLSSLNLYLSLLRLITQIHPEILNKKCVWGTVSRQMTSEFRVNDKL